MIGFCWIAFISICNYEGWMQLDKLNSINYKYAMYSCQLNTAIAIYECSCKNIGNK